MKKPRHYWKLGMLAVAVFAITSCGGGGGTSTSKPKVTYSDNVAAGTVANYTNADWLFQNYLGDYGVPEQLKPQFLPAMKMLANGFDLQLKTGQDVKGNIEQVHSMFLLYLASGEATKFFTQVQNSVSDPIVPTTKDPNESPANPNFIEPVISDEDRKAIAEAKQRDENERLEIQRIAKEYGLPYHIDETPEQWFIYSPSMKGGGKAGAGGRGTSGGKNHGDIRSWGWRPGDMVWVNGTGSIPGVPGHNAITWAEGANVLLIDANTDKGVSLAGNLEDWFERYTEVRALTPKLSWSTQEYNCYALYGAAYGCRQDSWQRINAWQYADRHRGYPYNWNFTNPRDTSKFYCSSLLWNAYDNVGFNLIRPWVLGSYGMITPARIRDSDAVTTFKISIKS